MHEKEENKDRFKNSIRYAHTPHPGEIVFNTIRNRSSQILHRLGYFPSSVSVQIRLMPLTLLRAGGESPKIANM